MAIQASIYSRFFVIENRKLVIADDSLGIDSDELVGTKIPLNLTISDRGNPPLSSLQLVEIEIGDRNDELPQFDSFSTQESILENRPIGYSIGTFGRTDVDLNSNISASLSCNCFKNNQLISSPCTILSLDTSLPTNIFISEEGFDYEIIDRIDCTAALKDENGELNLPQITEKSFRLVFMCFYNFNALPVWGSETSGWTFND